MFEQIIQKRFLTSLEQVRFGSIEVTTPSGQIHIFEGSELGAKADFHLESWSVVANLASKGEVGFASDYRDGLWNTSNLEALITFSLENEEHLTGFIEGNWLSRIGARIGYLLNSNSLRGSKRNIHAHYDLGNEFYSLWLDSTMSYSSALYLDPNEPIAVAQENKYDRLLDRIEDPSGSILEIGCGWGGFAERAITRNDREIKGVTLSKEQLDFASKRLNGSADFAFQDYRHIQGKFDNIVSIEMFEAVGIKYWNSYFSQLRRLLKTGGKALVQSIVIEEKHFESYRKGSDMVRSFIFPGGMLPSVERFEKTAQEGGMETKDVFLFGHDYARTLRVWLKNFDANIAEVRSLGFDESFIRIWRYYLGSCAASFQTGRINVGQFELQAAR
jgi:cyclopropane-fatty-acyl-phospholipid synthase|tara:strand:+ start:1263 stop:2426 length:1164 start_codon:yes stop_codon:yes gene_type:complete